VFEFVYFGFEPEDVLDLNLVEFDEALEILHNVRKRYGQEELIRQNVAAQGDSKAVKKLAKVAYTREGDRPLGVRTEQEFLRTVANGL
jgi:hypothetical protein